jgi:hypothetical protein
MQQQIMPSSILDESEASSSSSVIAISEVQIEEEENSLSFYELWNQEIHELKSAIDERLHDIAERSQKEIERLAATVTGITKPAKYTIRRVGPKIPPSQWHAHRVTMKQRYQQELQQQQKEEEELKRQQQQQENSKTLMKTLGGKLNEIYGSSRGDKSVKSLRDIRMSPSGRSHTTATSDKTIPQSNLSRHQPNMITNVLSIPEEGSLQPTTDEELDDNDDMHGNIDDKDSVSEKLSNDDNEDLDVISPISVSQSQIDNSKLLNNKDDNMNAITDYTVTKKSNDQIDKLNVAFPINTNDIDDFHGQDTPSMIASMSLSSTSQPSDRSNNASPVESFDRTTPKSTNKSKPSYRLFDLSTERRPRSLNGNNRPSQTNSLYSLLTGTQSLRQRDAPSTSIPFTVQDSQSRPDAPASLKPINVAVMEKKSIFEEQDKGDFDEQVTDFIQSDCIGHHNKTSSITLKALMDNSTATLVSTSQDNQDEMIVFSEMKSDIIDGKEDQDPVSVTNETASEVVPALLSTETSPSVIDKEVSAICCKKRDLDDNVLDVPDVSTNPSTNNSSQQRMPRKPPSPETFMMKSSRKKKQKKDGNVSSSSKTYATLGLGVDDKSSSVTLESLLQNQDTQSIRYDSLDESTIASKVEDQTLATDVPSTGSIVNKKDQKILPYISRDSVETSSVQLEYVTNHKTIDPYNEEGLYTGILIRGKPETHGTMKYNDGRFYTGSWKRGRWNGHGKIIFANGDTYTGDYVRDQRHGIGRYEWSDARVYDGRFENDQREGHGTYSWPNGSVYSGDFHLGLRHGYGTYTYEDGSVYCGEWQNGKQHGRGECVWAHGGCFRGEWLNGHTYSGVEVRADGTIRHDGKWHNNRPIRTKNVNKHRERQHKSDTNKSLNSYETDQNSKSSLEYLRQGKSLACQSGSSNGKAIDTI